MCRGKVYERVAAEEHVSKVDQSSIDDEKTSMLLNTLSGAVSVILDEQCRASTEERHDNEGSKCLDCKFCWQLAHAVTQSFRGNSSDTTNSDRERRMYRYRQQYAYQAIHNTPTTIDLVLDPNLRSMLMGPKQLAIGYPRLMVERTSEGVRVAGTELRSWR